MLATSVVDHRRSDGIYSLTGRVSGIHLWRMLDEVIGVRAANILILAISQTFEHG